MRLADMTSQEMHRRSPEDGEASSVAHDSNPVNGSVASIQEDAEYEDTEDGSYSLDPAHAVEAAPSAGWDGRKSRESRLSSAETSFRGNEVHPNLGGCLQQAQSEKAESRPLSIEERLMMQRATSDVKTPEPLAMQSASSLSA